MSTLVLEMRQGDLMIVNGAPVRFLNRTRVELLARARFLFGKQIMSPDEADTPVRRIYHALQCAYVGPEAGRAASLDEARGLISALGASDGPPDAHDILLAALEAAEADDCYGALKLVRQLVRAEDLATARVVGAVASPAQVTG